MEYKGLGLGAMSMNLRAMREGAAVVHAALEENVTLLNTADFYNAGESEMVLGEALKGQSRERFQISVKFGVLSLPGGGIYGLDVHPDRIKNYLTCSLKRLRLDYLDLYQPARIDLAIPVEETIGAIADLAQEGYVKHIGLTQVDANTLRRAHATHPIRLYEGEYSLFNRSLEREMLPVTRELGIPVLGFGVLAHGFLSGVWNQERIQKSVGGHVPLFFKENIEKNAALANRLQKIAQEKQIGVSQLAFAWMLSKGEDIIPLIGASRVATFSDSLKGRDIRLSESEVKRIEDAIPESEIAGASFPAMQFKHGVIVR